MEQNILVRTPMSVQCDAWQLLQRKYLNFVIAIKIFLYPEQSDRALIIR
jgi:hypothetical protein